MTEQQNAPRSIIIPHETAEGGGFVWSRMPEATFVHTTAIARRVVEDPLARKAYDLLNKVSVSEESVLRRRKILIENMRKLQKNPELGDATSSHRSLIPLIEGAQEDDPKFAGLAADLNEELRKSFSETPGLQSVYDELSGELSEARRACLSIYDPEERVNVIIITSANDTSLTAVAYTIRELEKQGD